MCCRTIKLGRICGDTTVFCDKIVINFDTGLRSILPIMTSLFSQHEREPAHIRWDQRFSRQLLGLSNIRLSTESESYVFTLSSHPPVSLPNPPLLPQYIHGERYSIIMRHYQIVREWCDRQKVCRT